jgi:decaprenylphospho-beta-D-ribofuranose 2-oxidase
MDAPASPLRSQAPWRVLEGFGGSVRSASRYAEPGSVDELVELLLEARRERLTVTWRGAGRSYGDAALNQSGLVVDIRRLAGVHSWDPTTGTLDAEPGVTLEDVWRRTLPDGFWPAVVPGTMFPTLGGCLSMNVHGKNNYRAGTFGEHLLDFDLVTPSGARLRCSRCENEDVFHAAVGGLGLLGAITRVRMRLKHVETGDLHVVPVPCSSLGEMLAEFESGLTASDYSVAWIDGLSGGRSLGRGLIHRARYVAASEIPDASASLRPEHQDLPGRVLGVPAQHLWRLMRPMMNRAGVKFVNAAKYRMARIEGRRSYLQSHVAFAFLLDYVPDWRLAYGPAGFIQYQVFVPAAAAERTLRSVLTHCQARGLPPFLCVLKRHRPDDFVLSHAVDGWSLALDFPVGRSRDDLWRLTGELTEQVVAAGGRFYFAKDAVLKPADVERSYGRERLDRFLAIKDRLDPDGTLTSDLWRRITPAKGA